MAAAFKAACVQVTAGPDPAANVAAASGLTREAAGAGADFVMLPEVVGMIEPDRAALFAKARFEEKHEGLAAFAALADTLGIWLLVGSLQVKTADGRLANRCFLIDRNGAVVARYDKIHMFDVDLDGGESYRESESYVPGSAACLAETPWGRIGLTICYDVRFPALYRTLAQAGAEMLTVPSAFTRPTGRAHWHVLLRARAIETGAYVFAPAQTGEHGGGRATYGHSLIVDPWGEVLADGGEEVGFVTADIDLARVAEARRKVPSLRNDRTWRPPEAANLRIAGE